MFWCELHFSYEMEIYYVFALLQPSLVRALVVCLLAASLRNFRLNAKIVNFSGEIVHLGDFLVAKNCTLCMGKKCAKIFASGKNDKYHIRMQILSMNSQMKKKFLWHSHDSWHFHPYLFKLEETLFKLVGYHNLYLFKVQTPDCHCQPVTTSIGQMHIQNKEIKARRSNRAPI